ncbi:Leucine-responsive regulatory protein [Pseudooctadecabacter jejudonensis]|uniref:Leucine-responsive regulatory protein n=2 Tax=Pseudooctadecabacter jejudonensis TaxID=1391910 RepID=A0A1Y5SUR4_9RHOB|nr:Leucine-responsive regulatory protein [Pseudooctadecabacter jejudonensis]
MDIRLLAALQKAGQASAADLSKQLGLSASQIGRRRQRLEQAGFIDHVVFRLNAKGLGLDVQAFIQIQTDAQTGTAHQSILKLVNSQPQIVAAWTLTGEADYIFRVFCPSLPDLNDLIQNTLLAHPAIGRVQSQIVMGELLDDTALPLDHLV